MLKKYFAFVAMVICVSFLAACAGSHGHSVAKAPENPVIPAAATSAVQDNLLGEWTQTNSLPELAMATAGLIDAKMHAIVIGNTITIKYVSTDTTAVYWVGSFDSKASATVISKRDVDATDTSLYASQDKTKTFTYKNGELSFDFSILGTKTTVHMSK